MSEQFNKKKHTLGLMYGVLAGAAFSITAWGIDSIILARAHITYAWIKFLPGLLLATLAGGLVGWISSKLSRGYVTIPLWFLFGVFLVWLITWLPFFSTPTLIKTLKPDLVDWIDYPLIYNLKQFRILGGIVIILPALICGLLESNVVETVMLSSHRGAMLTVILACGVLMGLGGFAGDELINKYFREPAVVLDNLFEFALKHQGEAVDEAVARRIHLSTVKGIKDLLPKSRKVTLIAYDEMLAQMDFLVDFDGIWVKCTTIYSQPTMCEQVPWVPVNSYYLNNFSSKFLYALPTFEYP
jgi:hypothetical protein